MNSADSREPPRDVWFNLEQSLDLLAALEDARDALIDAGHLGLVLTIEDQIRQLSRKLDFDDPERAADASYSTSCHGSRSSA